MMSADLQLPSNRFAFNRRVRIFSIALLLWLISSAQDHRQTFSSLFITLSGLLTLPLPVNRMKRHREAAFSALAFMSLAVSRFFHGGGVV
jgi:hypothetical protein